MKNFSLILTLVVLLGMSAPVAAKPVTLAYVDFPPYEYQIDGKPAGVLVEIVQDVFKRAGVELELVFYPFKRALAEVKAGRIDGLFNFYKNKERLQHFDYSDPVITNPLVLFVKNDSDLTFSGKLDDLKGKRIAAMLGYTYGVGFDDAKQFTIDRAASHEVNFKKVAKGRADAYPCDLLVGYHVLKKEELRQDIKALPTPMKVMLGHIGFTKGKHGDVIAKINKVIAQMKAKQEIAKRLDLYMKK